MFCTRGKGMNLANSARLVISSTYIEPQRFADYLSYQRNYCLFLDIDGTLAAFTLAPKDSVIPNKTLMLLQKIQSHGVKIAIVTGRSLIEAQKMLSPLQVPIAATHGLELAFKSDPDKAHNNNDENDMTSVVLIDRIELIHIKQAIIQSCKSYDDLFIEDKPYSVALHYRQNPTLADIAYNIMVKAVENHIDWILKQGKYVWEIMPKEADKGIAILTLLEKMQTDDALCPIFIGDDITDEAGFMAVQGNSTTIDSLRHQRQNLVDGIGIKVGNEPTYAHYYVHNIDEVTVLLDSFLTFCQKQQALFDTTKYFDSAGTKKTTGPLV